MTLKGSCYGPGITSTEINNLDNIIDAQYLQA